MDGAQLKFDFLAHPSVVLMVVGTDADGRSVTKKLLAVSERWQCDDGSEKEELARGFD